MSSSAAASAASVGGSGASVLSVSPLPAAGVWQTSDPFLFCVHHRDQYPAGTEQMGVPLAQLRGRNMGSDFSGKDGFSMYHGEDNGVPGFPQHPHRGFETITIVRQGMIDHSDSLGAQARFGNGDVQWLTAGNGISHSEMFPLVHREKPNPTELFQIWLNLPGANKMVTPYFSMQWAERIPRKTFTDEKCKKTEVVVVAGQIDGLTPLPPPPDSWASSPLADLAVWTLEMEEGASFTLPATTAPAASSAKGGSQAPVTRTLYFFEGAVLRVDGKDVAARQAITVRATAAVELVTSRGRAEVLVLQGRPIGEPVAQRGPFVMNTQAELAQAFDDYRRTRFGGWPHKEAAPVFPREQGRFAKHVDGHMETP